MAINIGDKVEYLGIKYKIKEVTDTFVTIVRENNGTMEVSIMRGSNRFASIFPNEVSTPKISFDEDAEPAVTYNRGSKGYIYNGSDEPLYADRSDVWSIIEKFSTETTEFESQSEAREALKAMLADDPTGITLFVATTYAHKNDSVKFDFATVADSVDSGVNMADRPMSYKPELLNIFKASLYDDDEATEVEVDNLIKWLPLKEAPEILTCICTFDWGEYSKWIIPPKQVYSILQEIEEQEVDELD